MEPLRDGELTSSQRLAVPLAVSKPLEVLLAARDYVDGLKSRPWDFAVELRYLESAGCTPSELRWLLTRGCVRHAIEVTRAKDRRRRFRPLLSPTFPRKTCFVLTAAGAVLARQICSRNGACGASNGSLPVPSTSSAGAATPQWDHMQRELRCGQTIIKRFRVPAPNQEIILCAFQEESWPARVDDPLPRHAALDPKDRLRETIKSLNRNQLRRLLVFHADGRGCGIRWAWLTSPPCLPQAPCDLPLRTGKVGS
jgi:hypothetical protein